MAALGRAAQQKVTPFCWRDERGYSLLMDNKGDY